MIFPLYKKKAALDLSVSFMVKLILAVTVFSLGLVIMRNIFSTAGSGDLTRNIDAEVEQQIRVLMDSGEKIIIFPEELRTAPNRAAVFGLGILNILNFPGETLFNVKIECYRYIPANSNQLLQCPSDSSSWTFDEYPEMLIRNHEEETIAIPVMPSTASRGDTYIYNVRVGYTNDAQGVNNELYGITKFRVVVT